MTAPAYRCAECVNVTERCASCRARRAKSVADRRAAHETAGLCVDCSRTAAVDVTTGVTLLQCELHRSANARRVRRARGALDVVALVLACGVAASTLVACEDATGYDEPTYSSTSHSTAGGPSSDNGAAGADGWITISVDPTPAPAGSAAPPPVVVDPTPAPAGSAAPPPVAGSPAPAPAGSAAPPPVAGSPAPAPTSYTRCKGSSGTIRSCTESDEHYHGNTYVTWMVWTDKSIGAGTGYNCTGLYGAQGTAPVCLQGAECRIVNRDNPAKSESGVCL